MNEIINIIFSLSCTFFHLAKAVWFWMNDCVQRLPEPLQWPQKPLRTIIYSHARDRLVIYLYLLGCHWICIMNHTTVVDYMTIGAVCAITESYVCRGGCMDTSISVLFDIIRQICVQNTIRKSCGDIKGILPKGPYLPCVSMAGRALLAGYPRYIRWGAGADTPARIINYLNHTFNSQCR